MLRFLLWFFAKKRLTYGDLAAFLLASYIGGWWFLPVLVIVMFLGSYISGIAEAWRDDKAGGEL